MTGHLEEDNEAPSKSQTESDFECMSGEPKSFTKNELDALVRDLNLSTSFRVVGIETEIK